MNQLNRELPIKQIDKNSKLMYGAVLMLMIGMLTACYMMWHYLKFGQWAMDEAFQTLAKNARTPWLDAFFRSITITGETVPVVLFTAIIAIAMTLWKKAMEGAMLSVYMIVVWRLNEFLKQLLHRPRPDVSLHLTDISNYSGSSQFSMPSGHSMNFMALLLFALYFLWIFSKHKLLNLLLTIVILSYGILVGLSRVYLNVHYISDVLTGWSAAAACTAAAVITHRLLKMKKANK